MDLIKDIIAIIKNKHRLVVITDDAEGIAFVVKTLDNAMKKSKKYDRKI